MQAEWAAAVQLTLGARLTLEANSPLDVFWCLDGSDLSWPKEPVYT